LKFRALFKQSAEATINMAASPLLSGFAGGGPSLSSGGDSPPSNKGHLNFKHKGANLQIRNVWEENVEEEMAQIRELVEKYPIVAMDTEFPGVVARPISESYSPDYHYKSLK
jgi:hypothetical protein